MQICSTTDPADKLELNTSPTKSPKTNKKEIITLMQKFFTCNKQKASSKLLQEDDTLKRDEM